MIALTAVKCLKESEANQSRSYRSYVLPFYLSEVVLYSRILRALTQPCQLIDPTFIVLYNRQ